MAKNKFMSATNSADHSLLPNWLNPEKRARIDKEFHGIKPHAIDKERLLDAIYGREKDKAEA